jgi:phage host-nuclease inhibitor protein Gam
MNPFRPRPKLIERKREKLAELKRLNRSIRDEPGETTKHTAAQINSLGHQIVDLELEIEELEEDQS